MPTSSFIIALQYICEHRKQQYQVTSGCSVGLEHLGLFRSLMLLPTSCERPWSQRTSHMHYALTFLSCVLSIPIRLVSYSKHNQVIVCINTVGGFRAIATSIRLAQRGKKFFQATRAHRKEVISVSLVLSQPPDYTVKTQNTRIVHRVVCRLTDQLSMIMRLCTHGGMARLS